MRSKGYIAEKKAADFLKDKGFEIIKRNFYCKGGEIDIIAIKDDVLHFVEVKSGNGAFNNLTPAKISRVIKCAQFFMLKNSLEYPFEIDVIVINEKIEFFENITL